MSVVTTLNKEVILQTLASHKKELSEFGVERIGLFGSFVSDESTSESDIDLLVELQKEKKTFKNFMALSFFLEELFDRKVELITRESLSPYLRPHILKTVEYVSLAS